jgi:hypothetical protein
MLVILIVVVAIVVAGGSTVALRRRSHDDVHSVDGYHRQLHTLEVMRTHQTGTAESSEVVAGAAFPESAFRVTPAPTVRLTEPGKPIVPPVAPPPVADPSKPVTFDDAGPVVSTPAPSKGAGSAWTEDKAMHNINRRPRRLAAPAMAVGAVTVLIVVLVLAGVHNSNPPGHHHGHTTTTSHPPVQARSTTKPTSRSSKSHQPAHQHTTTTTIAPPTVSLPRATSTHDADYVVQLSSYNLSMSATSSACWVDATEVSSGSVLFTGLLNPGQTQTVKGIGEVSLTIGAPDAFAANINGTAVSFPFGFSAPFTMHFNPIAGATASS